MQWFDILLQDPTHGQGQATNYDSGPNQVQTSGDFRMLCISASRTHPQEENIIPDNGMIFLYIG